MSVQKFVAIAFASRDFAHKNHLHTNSYSKHKALNRFYESIVEETDAFAELWQGRNEEKINDIPTYDSKTSGNPLVVLKAHLKELESLRDKVCGKCPVLQNKFDEVLALYLSTIYRLKFLE